MKNSIKRAQSQACLGFAERKNFRPLAKLKKLSLTFVALLSMTTGTWAQTDEVTVTPVSGQTNQWTFQMPASNVELQVEYEPEYTVLFKAGNANTIQSDKATVTVTESGATTAYTGATLDENGNYKPVYEGQTITLTAAAGYKFKSVEAKKGVGPYANAKLGDLFYSDGTFSSTLVAGKTPIGVIAYLDQEGTDDDEICEKSNGAGHGLVLCLKDAASAIAWSTEISAFEFDEDAKVADVNALKRTTNVSGYTNTKTLAEKTDAATKYKAAYAAKSYTGLTAPTGTTGWFLPSAQQWVKMQTGLGALEESSITWDISFDNNHEGADKWEVALSKAGSGKYDSMTSVNLWYWSSSEYSAGNAVNLNVCTMSTGYGCGFSWYHNGKGEGYTNSNFRVRPVLAF